MPQEVLGAVAAAIALVVSAFEAAVAPKLAGAEGVSEDQMRGPLEVFKGAVANELRVTITPGSETSPNTGTA